MPYRIFISLTKSDTEIADALRQMIRELLGDAVDVHYSTSKELKGGIRHGQDWFQWIVDQVRECDAALILITPSSVHKPWILWEAGAVHGAALASGKDGMRKVRPLVYQIDSDRVPSPIRDSKAQFLRGDQASDVETLCKEILEECREQLSMDRVMEAAKKLEGALKRYLERARETLLNAPMLPTPLVIEEWRLRLDALLRQNRASEVEYLHEWMDIAFGRGRDDQPQPLDLRIHTRLADLYMESKNYKQAIGQLELARQLAPRDIFVLRTLGEALMKDNDRNGAKKVIDRIGELDERAFTHNTECAALAGRWYREGGNREEAAKIYRTALDSNGDSHYLANLLAETRLELGETDAARDAFTQALRILEDLAERNVWTDATAANAAFFLGKDERAKRYVESIRNRQPGANKLATIENGLRKIAAHLDDGETRVTALVSALRS